MKSKLVPLLLALTFVVAACSDGTSEAEFTTSTLEGGDVDAGGSGSGSDGGTGGEGSASTAEVDEAGSQGSNDGDGGSGDTSEGEGGELSSALEPLVPGSCSVDQVFQQDFYAVSGIAEDDPDGGLNVRDFYDGGEKVATLSEGSIVLVEDCFAHEDGGVWWLVESGAQVFGWVNSSFLSSEISPLEPTSGGQETGRKVEALLDAFNGEAWAEAAELLATDSPPIFLPQLDVDAGRDLATDLAAYCGVRICDARFEIVAIRGSYRPSRIAPEVDVRFGYPQGSVVETFRGVYLDDRLVSLESLPGSSFGALREATSTADLVDTPADIPGGALQAAEEIRLSLLADDGPAIPGAYIPGEGVVISPNAYVDPEPKRRMYVTEEDLMQNGNQSRIWGYADGTGSPILHSINGWFTTYRSSMALQDPDVVGADGTRLGSGNTIANLGEQFPDATVIEFYRRGRGDLQSFNWTSVRIALEQREGDWFLVAITNDSWTI